MSSILVCSVKGADSIDVTVALGVVWPADGRCVTVVEADAAGGDLAARFGLAYTPGLVELAGANRRRTDMGLLTEHAQTLTFAKRGVRVVPAPPGGAQPRVALHALAREGSVLSGDARHLVLVDAGRVDPTGPAWPLVSIVDVVVVVVPARVEGLARLQSALSELRRAAADRLVVVLAPGERYHPQEVAEAVEVAVWGLLPADRAAVDVLAGRLTPRRWWLRLPLMGAVSGLARHLSDRLGPVPVAADEVVLQLVDKMAGSA
jgi:hypothetical protein